MRARAPDNPKDLLGDMYRPFHAVSEFMNNSGIGIGYAIPSTDSGGFPFSELGKRQFSNVRWNLYCFCGGHFEPVDADTFFGKWDGDRGRASWGDEWEQTTADKISALDESILTDLLSKELFMTGYVKSVLKKPLTDPYDVDSFMLSISQKYILPMEIKEKFPAVAGKTKFFGIDAGRIMMLLRLCLPNDANAIYLIRELDEAGRFVAWKYITLSDIIMTSSWNLQAGGPGMGGQSTQTVRLPYDCFREFTSDSLSEDNLKSIGVLPKDVKVAAGRFGSDVSKRFLG